MHVDEESIRRNYSKCPLFVPVTWILDLDLLLSSGWRTMLVVPELEKEVELLWELRNMRKVNGSSLYKCYYSQRSIKL